MASGLDPFWRPDVVHAHDWHAGLTPAYRRRADARLNRCLPCTTGVPRMFTRHMNDIELPWSFYNMHGLEFNGQISFLKAGLYYADHITAVSPTYAREITEPQYAYGMEGCCASAIMKVGCREFSTALTTVSGARKTICCCRCATIATRWRRRRRTSVSCRLPWA